MKLSLKSPSSMAIESVMRIMNWLSAFPVDGASSAPYVGSRLASVAEPVDAADSKSVVRKDVGVRVPPGAPSSVGKSYPELLGRTPAYIAVVFLVCADNLQDEVIGHHAGIRHADAAPCRGDVADEAIENT